QDVATNAPAVAANADDIKLLRQKIEELERKVKELEEKNNPKPKPTKTRREQMNSNRRGKSSREIASWTSKPRKQKPNNTQKSPLAAMAFHSAMPMAVTPCS